jgi:hypothetical protein
MFQLQGLALSIGTSASLYVHGTHTSPSWGRLADLAKLSSEKQHRSNGPCIAAEIRKSAGLFLKGPMYIIIYCDRENEVQRVEVA